MFNKLLFLIAGLLFCIESVSASTKKVTDSEYVIIASSFSSYHGWSNKLIKQVNRHFESEHPSLLICNEYLTSKCVFMKQEWDSRFDIFFETYSELPKMLVLVGDEAWIAFRKNAAEKWREVPLLLIGVQNVTIDHENYNDLCHVTNEMLYPISKSTQGYNATGVYREHNYKAVLNVIKQLVPATQKIAFISDNSFEGAVARAKFMYQINNNFTELQVENMAGCHLTTGNLYNRLYLQEWYSTVLVAGWNADQNYRAYTNHRLVSSINSFLPTPVFSIDDIGEEKGLLASGYYYTIEDYAASAIDQIDRVLAGTKPRTLPFVGPANKPVLRLDKMLEGKMVINRANLPMKIEYFNDPTVSTNGPDWRISLGILAIILLGGLLYWVRTKYKILVVDAQLQNAQPDLIRNDLSLALSSAMIYPFEWDLESDRFKFILTDRVPNCFSGCNFANGLSVEKVMESVPYMEKEVVESVVKRLKDGVIKSANFELHFDLDRVFNECYEVNLTVERVNIDGKPLRVVGAMKDITAQKEFIRRLVTTSTLWQEEKIGRSKSRVYEEVDR